MSARTESTGGSSSRRRRGASSRSAESGASHPSPRTGARRTLVDTIRQLPNYLRLLFGLLTDRRVSGVDKLLVAGAIAYIVMPIDVVPDFIPFLGEVDDVYLLVMSLQRLIFNAGRRVVSQHWQGDMADLNPANLRAVLVAASFFLPRRLRRRLRAIGRA